MWWVSPTCLVPSGASESRPLASCRDVVQLRSSCESLEDAEAVRLRISPTCFALTALDLTRVTSEELARHLFNDYPGGCHARSSTDLISRREGGLRYELGELASTFGAIDGANSAGLLGVAEFRRRIIAIGVTDVGGWPRPFR